PNALLGSASSDELWRHLGRNLCLSSNDGDDGVSHVCSCAQCWDMARLMAENGVGPPTGFFYFMREFSSVTDDGKRERSKVPNRAFYAMVAAFFLNVNFVLYPAE